MTAPTTATSLRRSNREALLAGPGLRTAPVFNSYPKASQGQIRQNVVVSPETLQIKLLDARFVLVRESYISAG